MHIGCITILHAATHMCMQIATAINAVKHLGMCQIKQVIVSDTMPELLRLLSFDVLVFEDHHLHVSCCTAGPVKVNLLCTAYSSLNSQGLFTRAFLTGFESKSERSHMNPLTTQSGLLKSTSRGGLNLLWKWIPHLIARVL